MQTNEPKLPDTQTQILFLLKSRALDAQLFLLYTVGTAMGRRRRYKRHFGRSYGKVPYEGFIFGAVLLIILGVVGTDSTIYATTYSFLSTTALVVGGLLLIGLLVYIAVRLLVFIYTLDQMQKTRRRSDEDYRARSTVSAFMSMDPHAFEHKVAWMYRQLGYQTTVTPAVIDGGVDIILRKNKDRIAVQVKRYASKNYVQRQEVQSFYGSYVDEGFTRGVMVTTSDFSERAREFAKNKNIELINHLSLQALENQAQALAAQTNAHQFAKL